MSTFVAPDPSKRRPRVGAGFFSLGAMLNGPWAAAFPCAPWTVTGAVLALLGCWDFLVTGGRIDAILLGLAAYELLIGLTHESPPSIHSDQHPSA